MALAFVAGSYKSAGNASGGNLSLPRPTNTSGHRIEVLVYFEPDTCNITVSDGPWETTTIANTGAFKLQSFVKISAGAEPANYTISNDVAGNQWRIASAVAYSGGTGSGTLIDVSSTNQGDGAVDTAQTAPSVTPTGTNRMVIFGYGNFGGNNPTSLVGFATNLRGTLGGLATGDALQATATATGTTREAGAGTQDFAAMHVALISDISSGPSPLVAAQGSFSLTGQASGFAVGMPAAQASFSLTGNAAGFAITLPSALGGFTLTGNAAALVAARILTGDQASFALTGEPVGFNISLPSDQGAFALAGQLANFGISMPLDPGSFSLTGNAAGLNLGKTLPSDAGTFSLTGEPANLTLLMPAGAGSFALNGQDATFSITLPTAAGVFTLTGNAAGLGETHLLTALLGTFSLTGEAATLAISMPGAGAIFSLTGEAAGFAITLPAGVGSFALTGNAANLTLISGKFVTAQAGTFTLTGEATAFGRTYILGAGSGSFALTGEDASLTLAGPAPAPAFQVTLAGGNIGEGYEPPAQPDPWDRIRRRLRRPVEQAQAASKEQALLRDELDIMELMELVG